ncbi:aspartate dehydrogenase [Yoonia sediminilitoris]|uniref:L-aspartate dehydrogenase n=1 Tax=Yoonia sediminilitoris TaxID=1286148 RepID=A0A2T6KHL2_9RHOB|nr:aspartate dehydrogenase [Yoonia sediminilitoris]PUB14975.1 aspartate dehydrogenase [Yoonia sediminilitoris]RCW95691.1 aspartate dehydrogenase [Yoonia sediminilitoris]
MHLGLIGFGSIGSALVGMLGQTQVTQVTALVRPASDAPQRHSAGPVPVAFVSSLDELIAARPDIVVECAGHAAVAAYAPPLLQSGHDVIIASVGALADAALQKQVERAAGAGKSRFILPSGAIGGLDLMRALAAAGDVDVAYRGIKPPKAWQGSPAEQVVDLNALSRPVTFFSGNGRDAALAYPKNANVVAALALAGAGFEQMRVELVADPAAQGNQHSYQVHSPFCKYTMTIEATGSPGNARTSVTTVLSILQEIATYQPIQSST